MFLTPTPPKFLLDTALSSRDLLLANDCENRRNSGSGNSGLSGSEN